MKKVIIYLKTMEENLTEADIILIKEVFHFFFQLVAIFLFFGTICFLLIINL
ncbi:hypothetical protein [Sphingobacterium thalpophilum]|uniref:hypothetical protein n=1 Tax=Sphingobacterium thalpophilum TaxID=259 RepID=UPI0024A6FA15|nr:hypothetical protein [Sphingobacterium thalpophilum]